MRKATMEIKMTEGEISADRALEQLVRGNARYVAGTPEHPHAGADRRAETSTGQHPFAIILTCSDSRVPPEIFFDQGIGDLFVVRVAGNVCNVDEMASIEYAVEHLGAPLCVILGHTQCGAVTAVATGAELPVNIRQLARPIRAAVDKVKAAKPDLAGDALIQAAITANVWHAVDCLARGSWIVQQRIKDGKLKVTAAQYDIATGVVAWLGEQPKEAVS